MRRGDDPFRAARSGCGDHPRAGRGGRGGFPWNFPHCDTGLEAIPAIACGNCVVFKPADLVPGSAWALTEIISRSGLPGGVFNLVMGPGSQVGNTLVNHPEVNAVTFTGSDAIGRDILAQAASRGAKVQLEMGGKNPLWCLTTQILKQPSTARLTGRFSAPVNVAPLQAGSSSPKGFMTFSLRRWSSGSKPWLWAMRCTTKPLSGPVSSKSQLDVDLEYLAVGRQEGAKLACGGEPLTLDTPGFYLSPALFVETDNSMRINQEEIFGPVASVVRVKDYEEALAIANDTRFGLSSGICTTSLKYASDFRNVRKRVWSWSTCRPPGSIITSRSRTQKLQLRAARAGDLCQGFLYHD